MSLMLRLINVFKCCWRRSPIHDYVGGRQRLIDISRALMTLLPKLLKTIPTTSILWVAYPKLLSKLAADLSRDVIHALAPKYGLDTVSQIAIDEDWSAIGLKRVCRLISA